MPKKAILTIFQVLLLCHENSDIDREEQEANERV